MGKEKHRESEEVLLIDALREHLKDIEPEKVWGIVKDASMLASRKAGFKKGDPVFTALGWLRVAETVGIGNTFRSYFLGVRDMADLHYLYFDSLVNEKDFNAEEVVETLRDQALVVRGINEVVQDRESLDNRAWCLREIGSASFGEEVISEVLSDFEYNWDASLHVKG